jgi:glycosyltransferase involved in cell wall biosynthesis
VEPRKNHRLILDAWRLVQRDSERGHGKLVIAGRRGWLTDDIEAEIVRDGAQLGIIRINEPNDSVVDALYQDSVATIHASWAEGFGLPVRESVARGIPTLLSSTIPRDGLPGGTFRLFDPTDVAGLAELMRQALENPLRRSAASRGSGTGWEAVVSALID